MLARIWGCRGSLATPGPETVRYGGNTSCVEVVLADGTAIVLDAGTGIRPYGVSLERGAARSGPVHIMLTHLHLDHIEGLGFFWPLWSPDVEVHIWGPGSARTSLEQRISRLLSPPLFPLNILSMTSKPVFHDVPQGPFKVGSATITAQEVVHQGPTLGYRIEENGTSFAYIPDHEPAFGSDLGATPPAYVSGHGVADGVDLLFHDSQYTEEEYPLHSGWGHSSTEHAVTFGLRCGVRRLVLFHHDPRHDDAQLEAMLGRALELWEGEGEKPVLAHEGMEIEL